MQPRAQREPPFTKYKLQNLPVRYKYYCRNDSIIAIAQPSSSSMVLRSPDGFPPHVLNLRKHKKGRKNQTVEEGVGTSASPILLPCSRRRVNLKLECLWATAGFKTQGWLLGHFRATFNYPGVKDFVALRAADNLWPNCVPCLISLQLTITHF